jgi:hypothetical protein
MLDSFFMGDGHDIRHIVPVIYASVKSIKKIG